ncbi:prephenate dehydratase [Acidianus brierleyi]|uniref:prephenate dehydratase n=1 Tax=Acidianus brierleyi TaxID=41673 RepID=UPI0024832F49|nr:prephenate dehydratase domain-containing protein [Acidianus brierleyi]
MYYLGPEGSFSHQASTLLSGKLIPKPTIKDIFVAVNNSLDALGVVPVENSIEGPVNETLDNLFAFDGIYSVYSIEIQIDLVLASKSDLSKVKKIYSHNHAIREAQNNLEKLGVTNFVPVESTSKAALMANNDRESAAICSSFAAKLYNLEILYDKIQDGVNITKFLVISKKMRTDGNKAIFLFTVPHKPGGLYRVIEKFYLKNINLTMIYSRPLRNTPWNYYFYLEFENFDNLSTLEKDVREVVIELKNKGSYTKLT